MVSHKDWSEIRAAHCLAPETKIKNKLNFLGWRTVFGIITTMSSALT